jgi:outer membrane protein
VIGGWRFLIRVEESFFAQIKNHKPQITNWFLTASLAVSPAVAQQPPSSSSLLLTIGGALRSALQANPDLANASDLLLSARVSERGVASTFLPQVTPFFSTDRSRGEGLRSETYGVSASEQFAFGPLVEGLASVTQDPIDSPGTPYASDYRLTLTQPLLRGADPAVTAEPLRQARRSTLAQSRAVEITRRRTVLLVYQAYLGVAEQQEVRRIALGRVERAGKLTEFSRARFSAGSVSRLDVLRAEQQEASAVIARNDAENLIEDLRDALRRATGLPRDLEFSIAAPSELPAPEADLDAALEGVLDRRSEEQEARDQVTDAEFALRIAKSMQLPSVLGVVSYEATGSGTHSSDAFRPRNPALIFGLRSQYGLNATQLSAQRREAEITLGIRKRNLQLLEDDLVREVRRAYRRLDSLKRNHEIAVENRKVAELQAQVAQLRFEKGLSDNFNVVDAENLLNSARLLELDSRFAILLARLDCLYSSGLLETGSFLAQP